MSEWKPGDVAMVTALNRKTPYRAYLDVDASGGDTWREYGGVNSCLNSPATIRPLVVIDPEDADQVARLADAFCSARWSHLPDSEECDPLTRSSMQAALREFAAPTPPKCSSSLTVDGNHVVCDRDYSPHAGWHHNGVAGISWAGETR